MWVWILIGWVACLILAILFFKGAAGSDED